MAIKLKVQSDPNIGLGVQDTRVRFGLSDQIQVVQSGDYNDLTNKPSLNGVTLQGDKSITIGYDESVSVGSAEVGTAVTGEPTYTPTGTVNATVTKERATVMSGADVALNYGYASYKLNIYGLYFLPTTTTKNIVTGVSNLNFTGNGVKFAVEMEN